MSSRSKIVLALVFLAAGAARAQGPEAKRVVVLDIGGANVPPDLARALSDVLVSAVRDQSAEGVTVIGQADVGAMLSLERQKDLLGCTDSSACLSEIGGALGADHLVAGSLGKIGTVFVVTLRLIDTQKSEVVRHVSDRVEGKDELLIEAVSQLARSLIDPARRAGQGFVRVRDAGVLSVDGTTVQAAPVDRLPLGRGSHEIALLDGSGKTVWRQRIDVAPYEVTSVGAPALPAPAPLPATPPVVETAWYGHWWLWTAVGVVAAGAGAAYLATRPAASAASSGRVSISLTP